MSFCFFSFFCDTCRQKTGKKHQLLSHQSGNFTFITTQLLSYFMLFSWVIQRCPKMSSWQPDRGTSREVGVFRHTISNICFTEIACPSSEHTTSHSSSSFWELPSSSAQPPPLVWGRSAPSLSGSSRCDRGSSCRGWCAHGRGRCVSSSWAPCWLECARWPESPRPDPETSDTSEQLLSDKSLLRQQCLFYNKVFLLVMIFLKCIWTSASQRSLRLLQLNEQSSSSSHEGQVAQIHWFFSWFIQRCPKWSSLQPVSCDKHTNRLVMITRGQSRKTRSRQTAIQHQLPVMAATKLNSGIKHEQDNQNVGFNDCYRWELMTWSNDYYWPENLKLYRPTSHTEKREESDVPSAQRCSQHSSACAAGTRRSSWASVLASSRTVWPRNDRGGEGCYCATQTKLPSRSSSNTAQI